MGRDGYCLLPKSSLPHCILCHQRGKSCSKDPCKESAYMGQDLFLNVTAAPHIPLLGPSGRHCLTRWISASTAARLWQVHSCPVAGSGPGPLPGLRLCPRTWSCCPSSRCFDALEGGPSVERGPMFASVLPRCSHPRGAPAWWHLQVPGAPCPLALPPNR